MNGKSHTLNVDNFRGMLQIYPTLPGQNFKDPPFEKKILSFIRDLRHTGEIKVLSYVNVNQMHQPWRSFAAVINKCLSGKTTGHDSLRLSRTHKGTSLKPGVPDAPKYSFDDQQISWKSSNKDDDDKDTSAGDDDDDQDDDDQDDDVEDDDDEQTESDNDRNDFVHPKLSTFDVEERRDESWMKKKRSSFVSSGFISNMLNPNPDIGIDSILNLNIESTSLVDVPVTMNVEMTPSSMTRLPPPPIPLIQPQHQTPVLTLVIIPSTSLQNLPTFDSLLKFEDRVKTLEDNFLDDQQKTLYQALNDAYETNKVILDTYGDTVTIKIHRDDEDDDEEPSAGTNRGSKRRRARNEPESTSERKEKTSKSNGKSNEGFKSHQNSTGKSAQAEEPIHTANDHTSGVQYSNLAQKEDTHDSFNEKGSCKSLVELEYFLKEVCKATTDQLDWNNPEGHQYPHDLCKPLQLIPNSRGHRVIPFDHFINNDLVYLSGGISSRTYATSVTKTKAADYRHIKWIEDLVPNTMWSQVAIVYNKHAL
nr:hypothetical protein [Tanacetum cinerariifolium]